MNELNKTLIFCATAAVLSAASVFVDPGTITPEIFDDQGEPFFAEFTDALAPKVIEVIDYSEATATARPLKVEFKDNKWTIPSHHNYPADAEDRLAKTSAALMELRRDITVSDRIEDHSEYGVVDPLDQKVTSLAGRGKRVTLRDEDDNVLADFVVGRTVPGKPGYRYMRVPNQRRTYAVKTDADVSVEFNDWIETDLLKLETADIRKVSINSYSINEQRGILENVEKLTLTKKADKWIMSGRGTAKESKTDALASALDNLRIVNVQPKPANLTHDLKTRQGIQLSMDSVMSLRQKGFFVTNNGQLFSNEGEIIVDTANGLQYTLRFGEIASGGPGSSGSGEAGSGEAGSGEAGSGQDAGKEEADGDQPNTAEDVRRYLFITVNHSDARAKQYTEEGKEPDEKGKALALELQNRFADWYYVISGADFSNLRPRRRDLISG